MGSYIFGDLLMMNNWRVKAGQTSPKDLGRNEFLHRIKKTLHYSKLSSDCFSLPVTEFTSEFFTEVKNGYSLERLDVEETSKISRSTFVTPCSFVLAFLYIERLKNCNPEYLRQTPPSELFLVSIMIASKFLYDDGDDDEVFNTEFARSRQLSLLQMKKLEKDFLAAIQWTIFVSEQDFWKRLEQLEEDVAYRQIQKRGWCTYTEMSSLINFVQLIAIGHTLMNICSICLMSYTAGVVILLGSALVASYLPGTSLSQTQPGNLQMNFTSPRTVLSNSETQYPQINDDLLTSNWRLLICNETVTDSPIAEIIGADSWKWWHNSTMIWLPEYSAFPDDVEVIQPRLYVAYMEFSLDLMRVNMIQNPEGFISENCGQDISWKEVLSSDKMPTQTSRQYTNYVSKVSLSHRC